MQPTYKDKMSHWTSIESLHDEFFHGRFNNQVIVSIMYILYEACNYMATRFL